MGVCTKKKKKKKKNPKPWYMRMLGSGGRFEKLYIIKNVGITYQEAYLRSYSNNLQYQVCYSRYHNGHTRKALPEG